MNDLMLFLILLLNATVSFSEGQMIYISSFQSTLKNWNRLFVAKWPSYIGTPP